MFSTGIMEFHSPYRTPFKNQRKRHFLPTMKSKPQASRKGRLSAFYENREYLSDEDVRDERYMERTQQARPERSSQSFRRQRRRKQRDSSRRNKDSETIINSSNLFKLGSAGLSIAIDMVLAVFDPCGALQDVIPDSRHDDPSNERRQHGNSPSEEIHLERTLNVPHVDEKGGEDATLISGLTDVFT